MPQIHPDEETKKRIKNLSAVGKALAEETNDNQGSTNQFLAKTALNEFEAGINKLELDPESLDGMKHLIKLLNNLIEQKMGAISEWIY